MKAKVVALVLKTAYGNFDIKTKTVSSVLEATYSFPLVEDGGKREGGNQSVQHYWALHKFLNWRETSTVRHSNYQQLIFIYSFKYKLEK